MVVERKDPPKPIRPPSRKPLDRAEEGLRKTQQAQAVELAEIDARIAKLAKARKELLLKHRRALAAKEAALHKAEEKYSSAGGGAE